MNMYYASNGAMRPSTRDNKRARRACRHAAANYAGWGDHGRARAFLREARNG